MLICIRAFIQGNLHDSYGFVQTIASTIFDYLRTIYMRLFTLSSVLVYVCSPNFDI
jgi:hypothetical protein